MKLREALAEAYGKNDLKTAGRIIDRLRFHGLGPCAPFNYEDLLKFAQDAIPGLDRLQWDAFLYEIDAEESGT